MSMHVMVVGSLNREAPYFQGARGKGLSIFRFDSASGHAELLCEDGGVDNPTFLSAHPTNGCLYVNSEVFGWHEGTVSAYRFDSAENRLAYLNKQPSLGSITAHNSLSRDGLHLFVVNYAMFPHGEGPDQGLVVYGLADDGRLLPPTASLAHRGSGPNAERQDRSHPHSVLQSPDSRFVVVADLGLDALFTYKFQSTGLLSAEATAVLALPKGSGPRHFTFHPNGRFAFVICELNSTIVSVRFDADRGSFSSLGTVSTTFGHGVTDNHCSDIQIHPSGMFVCGANRGHDTIATFSVDPDNGGLSPLQPISCGGMTPRHLAFDPAGNFLLVANQNSDKISVFPVAPSKLSLSPAAHDIHIGSPMCIKFLPQAPGV